MPGHSSPEYNRQRRQQLEDQGLCKSCGKGPPRPGLKTCQTCYERRHDQLINDSQYRKKVLDYSRQWTQNNWIRHLETRRQYGIRIRQEMLNAYGTRCLCCGESDPVFLTFDHINGGGNEHRRQLGTLGDSFYKKMRKLGFPPILQTLCWNCHMAKDLKGGCPHKKPIWEVIHAS